MYIFKQGIAGYEETLPVAVKTLSSTSKRDLQKFMEEIDLMKKFCHPNIVSLLGVNCHYSEGAPLMILEYMPYGDLQGFLEKHRLVIKNHNLCVFCWQIAVLITIAYDTYYRHTELIKLGHQIKFASDVRT